MNSAIRSSGLKVFSILRSRHVDVLTAKSPYFTKAVERVWLLCFFGRDLLEECSRISEPLFRCFGFAFEAGDEGCLTALFVAGRESYQVGSTSC